MNRYTVAVLVRNQFGVLNRVTSMFRRRQFNIIALSVSETESVEYSRITVTFEGEENNKQQLINQLYKLPDVFSIKEFNSGNSVSCELLLIKMQNDADMPATKYLRRRRHSTQKRLTIQRVRLYFSLRI